MMGTKTKTKEPKKGNLQKQLHSPYLGHKKQLKENLMLLVELQQQPPVRLQQHSHSLLDVRQWRTLMTMRSLDMSITISVERGRWLWNQIQAMKMEIVRMKRMKKVNLVGLKKIQFHTTLNFIIRVTYKRINRTHLCLLQAHPHY
jgi:hypothetical protein